MGMANQLEKVPASSELLVAPFWCVPWLQPHPLQVSGSQTYTPVLNLAICFRVFHVNSSSRE